ncbi:MAG TPA: hypothetical protein VGQ28_04640 [Thermoanaerobaculia bacterium]|jgi:hypothetical protein|nr:hypothetical protein [Thermoanaerobaculia bacterium]
MAAYAQNVFINCPFDARYNVLFEAIVFAVSDCGYQPRCALEIDDGGQIRVEKIFTIISECKFGIHDISTTELDEISNLPRFNMPLELGMFLGAKRFGSGEQKEKVSLILDRESFRYQKYISDLAGQDIRAHGHDPKEAIRIVRNWLSNAWPEAPLPGGDAMAKRYEIFRRRLPVMCRNLKLSLEKLTFTDYAWLVWEWLKKNP